MNDELSTYIVADPRSDQLVGIVRLDGDGPTGELRYCIALEYERQGYAYELTSQPDHPMGAGHSYHPDYRLFALVGTVPPKPGLLRAPGFLGPGIDVEIWSFDPASFGQFVAGIPQTLGIGKLTLSDGSIVSGVLCEPAALEGAQDITQFGGWRAYVTAGKS